MNEPSAKKNPRGVWTAAALFAVVAIAMFLSRMPLPGAIVGLAALFSAGLAVWKHRRNRQSVAPETDVFADETDDVAKIVDSDDADDSDKLANEMMRDGRYSLLLRAEVADALSPDVVDKARELLDHSMTIVPLGEVYMELWRPAGSPEVSDDAQRLVEVDGLFLDRHAVTNDEYQKFVDSGGYEQIALWDPTIWPGVIEFVDQTGLPGPKFWSEGRYPKGQGRYPVVGVSWFEATAFARWVGKRLPSDPEWVRSACWPIPVPGQRPLQRRYPWGDSMDRGLANLWNGSENHAVPVDEHEDGASVSGALQLVGNVWEWTTGNYGTWQSDDHTVMTDTPYRSVRGGAYDTYCDGQCTCHFQSGESPHARKQNIGFRCALSVCDVIFDELHVPAEEDLDTTHLADAHYEEEPV